MLSQSKLEPLPLAIMAIAFGLTRALFPFLYLRHAVGIGKLHWFPLTFHLVHHVSAIVGAILFSVSLKLQHYSPAFLSSLAKTVCLLCLAIFHWFVDDALPSPVPFLSVVPLLFIVGTVDGLQQRMLLTEVIDVQRATTVTQQRYNLFTLLLLTSFGPLITSLLIETKNNTAIISHCFGICPFSIQFGIRLPATFVMLAFMQALLLPSLWLSQNVNTPEGRDNQEEEGEAIQYLPTLAKCPPPWRLLIPLCALCAFSSALFNNFGTILFSSMPSTKLDEFPLEKINYVVFSASALFSRVALAISQCSAISQSKIAKMIHTNAFFTIGLFGSGIAFCTLNVPSLRTVAVALFGASLALFWPTMLAQWCNFQDSMRGKNSYGSRKNQFSSIIGLLISVEIGSCLFPLLFTQLLAVYGSPRLFNTVALLLIIAMVVTFVRLLNVQAEYKMAKRGEFWGFLGGGRTRRSIRRLMRSVRTSLRRTANPAGRHRQRRLRPRVGTETALLDERRGSAGGGISRISNYYSVKQAMSEHGEQRSRINTAYETILTNNDQKKEIGKHGKRHISMPDIMLNVGTEKMEEEKSEEERENEKEKM